MKRVCATFVLVASLASQVVFALSQDGDPLSDVWESIHGFSLQVSGIQFPEQAAGADPDGDALTNLEEAEAGTNPFHATPFIRGATSAPGRFNAVIASEPTGLSVFWWGIRGKYYRFLVSPDLSSGWTPAASSGVPLAFAGKDLEMSFPVAQLDTFSEDSDLFIRVEVYDLFTAHSTLTDWEYLQLTETLSTSPSSGSDLDGDGVSDSEDAVPFDRTVGRVSIAISSPAQGAQIQ